jgi:hypothetical protein
VVVSGTVCFFGFFGFLSSALSALPALPSPDSSAGPVACGPGVLDDVSFFALS